MTKKALNLNYKSDQQDSIEVSYVIPLPVGIRSLTVRRGLQRQHVRIAGTLQEEQDGFKPGDSIELIILAPINF